MSLNRVAFSEGKFYIDLLNEQKLERQAFISNTRLEFIVDVARYFRYDHHLSEQQLVERRAEVSVRLINFS